MANGTIGRFADLSSYRAAVDAAKQRNVDPLSSLIQGFQQGQAIANLPQTMAEDALNKQLALEIQRANLAKLQRPQVFNTAAGLAVEDINDPTGFRIVSGTTPLGKDFIETSAGMLRPTAAGGLENVFPFTQTPTGPLQQVVNVEDPNDVRFARPDVQGKPPAGFQFSKAMEQPMKPSEKISAIKDLRQAHGELQSKLLFFGKGETPGVYGIKKKLDAVLKPVNFDFSKLNPQAKQGFVFAANKLRDPTSATLLAEAKQIADKAGVLDRFNAFVDGFKEGDPLPDQVAKDIYQIITQTNDLLRADYLEDLPYFRDKTKSLGEPLQSLGIPKSFSDELEAMGQQIGGQVVSPVATPGINDSLPSPVVPSTPVIPSGMKLQRNSRTGETRLVPK